MTEKRIRRALEEATDALDQARSVPERRPEFTYVPPSHARALDLDATLVEGIRGSGKSFWWAQLASEQHRRFVRASFREARLPEDLRVVQGFGSGLSLESAPDAAVLTSLVERFQTRSIWKAVIAKQLGLGGKPEKLTNWSDRVAWIEGNPEAFGIQMEEMNSRLKTNNQSLLILFDALDRLADDWDQIRPLVKGLLQVALDLRSTSQIRCKIYLRPDILRDSQVTQFPDFSKLLAGKASLEWRRADLYALLFQCLGNAREGGKEFRDWLEIQHKLSWRSEGEAWGLPIQLRTEEGLQERVFEGLAGKAMGRSQKRGKPYTWLVNHLQDGLDQVSPRSFFSAIRTAARETPDDFELPLDYRGIQKGVQSASQIRVQEIIEDYPWVRTVMEPLRGITVPCESSTLIGVWEENETLDSLEKKAVSPQTPVKLPPQHREQGANGILVDLEALGMVRRIEGSRIQMPDVYRIAFGLGRRGGVKPLK